MSLKSLELPLSSVGFYPVWSLRVPHFRQRGVHLFQFIFAQFHAEQLIAFLVFSHFLPLSSELNSLFFLWLFLVPSSFFQIDHVAELVQQLCPHSRPLLIVLVIVLNPWISRTFFCMQIAGFTYRGSFSYRSVFEYLKLLKILWLFLFKKTSADFVSEKTTRTPIPALITVALPNRYFIFFSLLFTIYLFVCSKKYKNYMYKKVLFVACFWFKIF